MPTVKTNKKPVSIAVTSKPVVPAQSPIAAYVFREDLVKQIAINKEPLKEFLLKLSTLHTQLVKDVSLDEGELQQKFIEYEEALKLYPPYFCMLYQFVDGCLTLNEFEFANFEKANKVVS